MSHLSPFVAPTHHADPDSALAQVRLIYAQQIGHLRDAMQRFVAGETFPGHVRSCYPYVRIHTETVARQAGAIVLDVSQQPGAVPKTDTYIALMDNIVRILVTGLQGNK